MHSTNVVAKTEISETSGSVRHYNCDYHEVSDKVFELHCISYKFGAHKMRRAL